VAGTPHQDPVQASMLQATPATTRIPIKAPECALETIGGTGAAIGAPRGLRWVLFFDVRLVVPTELWLVAGRG